MSRQKDEKTSEGEPVVCARGFPPFSRANVPIIIVELSNKIIKCLMNTGCSRCLVKTLGLKVFVCKEGVSLMNGSISYCNECCVCDVRFDNGVCIQLNCLVSDLLFDYSLLFGCDGIKNLGGLLIDHL